MATIADLNVSIGADLAPLESGLQQAQDDFKTFADTASTSTVDVGKAIADLDTQLTKLYETQAKLSQGGEGYAFISAQIDETIQKIEALENSEAGLARQQQILAQTSQQAAQGEQQLGDAAQGASRSSLALDSSISRLGLSLATGHVNAFALTGTVSGLTREFNAAKAAGASTAEAMESLGGALANPELLIFAAASGLALLADNLLSASKHTDEFTKAQKEAEKAIDDAQGKAASESAELQSLLGIAANVNLSIQQRTAAYNQLESKYGQYLEGLSKEAILTGNVADALKRANAELLNKALYEAEGGTISKLAAQLASINDELQQSQQRLEAIKKQSISPASGGTGGASTGSYQEEAILENRIKDLTSSQASLTAEINKTISAQRTYLQGAITGGNQVLDIYGKLNAKLDEINNRQEATGGNLSKDKISALKTAINDLLNAGVQPADAGLQELIKTVKDLGGTFDEKLPKTKLDEIANVLAKLKSSLTGIDVLGGLNGLGQQKENQQRLSELEGALKKLIELGASSATLQPIIDQVKKLRDLIFEPVPKNVSLLDPFTDQKNLAKQLAIADRFNVLLEQGWDKLAKDKEKRTEEEAKKEASIYRALGTEIQSAFDTVFTTLLEKGQLSFDGLIQGLEKLIAKLAATAAEAAILSLILSSITGGSLTGLNIANALGANSTGFGSIFGALFKHADGGIFTGPTVIGSHVFGEAGPEALIPLNGNLDALKQQSQQRILPGEIISRIEGNDIVLVYNRQARINNRNYGNFTNE